MRILFFVILTLFVLCDLCHGAQVSVLPEWEGQSSFGIVLTPNDRFTSQRVCNVTVTFTKKVISELNLDFDVYLTQNRLKNNVAGYFDNKNKYAVIMPVFNKKRILAVIYHEEGHFLQNRINIKEYVKTVYGKEYTPNLQYFLKWEEEFAEDWKCHKTKQKKFTLRDYKKEKFEKFIENIDKK